MITSFVLGNQRYSADFSQGRSIAITLHPNGAQPNHFNAPLCTIEPLNTDNFTGDTRLGGSCNVSQLTVTAHCNGTHTETVSHLVNDLIPVHRCINSELFPCTLISVTPTPAKHSDEQYASGFDQEDQIITKTQLKQRLEIIDDSELQGLVIRTLPNDNTKCSRTYLGNNQPCYLTNDAMHYICERNVSHLFVDIPSVDKMYDQGKLSNHRIFWQLDFNQKVTDNKTKKHKTITEMVYVPSDIHDGLYICNLQIPQIAIDAVPSRPILTKLSLDTEM